LIDRKDFIIIALVSFMLVVTLYPRITTSNTWEPINPYDPWIDWDDNGEIDIFDKVAVGSRFGSEGDPTKNVNVTNFPLDEEGNLKVSIAEEPLKTYKDVAEITVFKTDAQSDLTTDSPRCSGGAQLENAHSMFTFCFLPKRMPFNVTEVWMSLVIFAGPQTYPTLYTTQFTITLNSQSQAFNTEYTVSSQYLKVFSLNISNPSLTNSIQEGINFLQVTAISACPPSPVIWYNDLATEITIFIEYEYQA